MRVVMQKNIVVTNNTVNYSSSLLWRFGVLKNPINTNAYHNDVAAGWNGTERNRIVRCGMETVARGRGGAKKNCGTGRDGTPSR